MTAKTIYPVALDRSGSVHPRGAATPFDALPDAAYVRQPQVLQIVPFSAATLWRQCKKDFPAPVRLSDRVTAWRVGEIRLWLEAQRMGAAK
jgi:prophage regulatory protein